MKVKKAIITVAGLGTRFLPVTKSQPKAMLPIVDKPVIHYLVEEVVASGIEDIILVTGKGKRAIEDYFDYAVELENALISSGKKDLLQTTRQIANLANISYVRQKEPAGNGDAILCARPWLNNEPVAVLFEDDIVVGEKPCLAQLIEVFEKYEDSVVALEKVTRKESFKYGMIDGVEVEKDIFEISRFVEKPRPAQAPNLLLGFVGKAILTPEVFVELNKIQKLFQNKKHELGLVDAFQNLLKRRSLYGLRFQGKRYDCGSKIGFLKAVVDFGLSHAEVKKEFKQYLKNLKI
ncbi:UTP--glucose-1-phosphate uridylyltransferase [Patescibacteria group bacterium]|nr:UTP--glucose-1-phosphate uridylyltransferase [Patescibacteria group bacterium]